MDTSPPMDDASQPLAAAWLHTLQHTGPAATALLHAVATDAPAPLAQRFYDVLLVDARARRFLSHEQVKQRLQPAMQRWLVQLLTTTAGDIAATVAAQRIIGDVHARVGIPVDLVTRGARVLKHDLYGRLQARADHADTAFEAIRTASALVDIAMEGMTLAYTHARDRSTRADAAYRLFSLVQNVGTERERQRALLLDWENTLLYTLAGHAEGENASLATSEFGLWFTHKGIPSFGESSETAQVSALVKAIDACLQQASDDAPAQRLAALPAIRERLAAIRTLMTLLFERIGELDAGSDSLTHLLNRRFLPTVLRREIELATRNQTPFALLMLDLDHFKAINDGHGHDAGDRALQHVAGLLGQLTRGSDYLFRFGGEEFVVVLVAASQSQAALIAESLRRQIAQAPVMLGNGTSLALTTSIGVAGHDGHPDYERLLARADAAMYAAKRRGRNCVVVAEEGLPEAPGRRSARAL
ncbi:diguanylate cyclase [Stenotrophomonas sp. 24(2023)]|uniref:diguanylate cyclase n=1 Tax=Stenotrophomonas sp. 24(2023) TaxID=3068324 RepID=UPI0027DF9A94|nr:diguanylate cyclase [Stenotrophomonas sp. 24(2023)]WMJ68423.1 diguanylate cyclase [Stenotrophomonas sp. 24(2023)]